jgi:hypothetical protein
MYWRSAIPPPIPNACDEPSAIRGLEWAKEGGRAKPQSLLTKADHAIQNRLWAETRISPEFPTSQEYLATDPNRPFFGYHRVFAWNAFVLGALEMVGLRTPEMDPDHVSRCHNCAPQKFTHLLNRCTG